MERKMGKKPSDLIFNSSTISVPTLSRYRGRGGERKEKEANITFVN
ncbi:MAG: hypothetical protein JSV75_01205 [Candidatus Bathyarchaeota archaeon]|nr:MAG: hypothetical protein JSV75_01205 [Candidatus Bathyarchaeota archaeon]